MVSDHVSSYHEYLTKVGVEVGCRVGVVVRRMKWAELNVVVGSRTSTLSNIYHCPQLLIEGKRAMNRNRGDESIYANSM